MEGMEEAERREAEDEMLRMDKASKGLISAILWNDGGGPGKVARNARDARNQGKMSQCEAKTASSVDANGLESLNSPRPPANRLVFETLHRRIPVERHHRLVELPGHPAVGKHATINGVTK